MSDEQQWGTATTAIRTGHNPSPEGEHSEPIFPTSSFVFGSASEAAARFSGEDPGNIYSRFTNPTVRCFEQRLAAMEGGESCVATASGMAAILAVCLGLLEQGDHIVSSRSIFGTTTVLFTNYLPRFGIETTFVDLDDPAAWEEAMQPNTRLLFLETPSNPLTQLGDIRTLADLAQRHDALLVVDNCFCTPVLQRPLDLGADIIIHSATKYLDGQGPCVGGAVVGDAERVGKEVFGCLRTAEPTMSPFNAWVFLKGLETLNLRMEAHCRNAAELAAWLEQTGLEPVFGGTWFQEFPLTGEGFAGEDLAGRTARNVAGLLPGRGGADAHDQGEDLALLSSETREAAFLVEGRVLRVDAVG